MPRKDTHPILTVLTETAHRKVAANQYHPNGDIYFMYDGAAEVARNVEDPIETAHRLIRENPSLFRSIRREVGLPDGHNGNTEQSWEDWHRHIIQSHIEYAMEHSSPARRRLYSARYEEDEQRRR